MSPIIRGCFFILKRGLLNFCRAPISLAVLGTLFLLCRRLQGFSGVLQELLECWVACTRMFQELVVVYVHVFGPPLNHVQTEEITRRRSRQIIFVHADLVKIPEVLGHLAIDLLVPRLLDLLDEPLLADGTEWCVKVAQLEDYTPKGPDIRSTVITFSSLPRWVIEDFWTLIEQRTHIFHHGRAPPTATGDSKVTNLNGIIFTFQKYIAGL